MTIRRAWNPQQGERVENCEARLHDFNGFAKLVIEIESNLGAKLLEAALGRNGRLRVELNAGQDLVDATIIEARMDTFRPDGQQQLNREGQPGLISLAGLTLEE